MNDFEFMLLNQYIGVVNSILKQVTGDIPESKVQQIKAAMGKIADVWTSCIVGKSNLSQFQAALSEWQLLQSEAVKMCLSKRPDSSLIDAYIKAVNEVIGVHIKDAPVSYKRQVEEKGKCLEAGP